MQTWLLPYAMTVFAMAAVAALFLLQILVVDAAGIKGRHVPGMPIPADHSSFLFRASRAHANTNESLGAFILLVIVAILLSASPSWTNGAAWLYVAGRAGHMVCYYADWRFARSSAFVVALLALFILLGAVAFELSRLN
jgi:uncharacterized MAPEG superfamily protein